MARPPTASGRRAGPATTHFSEIPVNGGRAGNPAQAQRLGGQGFAGQPNAPRPPQPQAMGRQPAQPGGLQQIFDDARRETAAERPERTATQTRARRGLAAHLTNRRPRDETTQTNDNAGTADRSAASRGRSDSTETETSFNSLVVDDTVSVEADSSSVRSRSNSVQTTSSFQSFVEFDMSALEDEDASVEDAETSTSDDDRISQGGETAHSDHLTEDEVDHDPADDVTLDPSDDDDPDDIAATTKARLFR
ncbi:hypothetical protein [Yoonia sp. BS5-3]|uniref:Uncharacterized protein n=1 Tax=Yoonia phaeophyticola TaxID=3137369 RepID=A0ABZ2V388_9RHOB